MSSDPWGRDARELLVRRQREERERIERELPASEWRGILTMIVGGLVIGLLAMWAGCQ